MMFQNMRGSGKVQDFPFLVRLAGVVQAVRSL